MKYALTLMALVFACFSCETPRAEKPADLLPEEKVVAVLTELELLEAVYTLEFQKRDTARAVMAPYYDEVFARHGVSPEQFTSSLAWHGQDPERIRNIRYKVYDELSKMQAGMKGASQRDSLQQSAGDTPMK